MRLNRLFLILLFCAGLSHAQILVTLSTSTNSMTAGQGATLTAVCTAPAGTNTAVSWSLSGPGTLGVGNNQSGTSITSTNNYAAPSVITQRQTITITARSVADSTKSASVSIQLNPASITVTPATATVSPGGSVQFSATGGGAGYIWSISPNTGSIDQNGLYTAPATATSSTTITVTATSDADATVTGTARLTLSGTPAVTVTISPTTASLTQGQTQQFTATVTNGSTTAVIWTISPQTGSIDNTGLYTAPGLITSTSSVRVTATAVADASKSASATVTLSAIVDVGSGAPNGSLQNAFINAFFRNGFYNMVSLPPLGNVKRLGTTGYVQEFNDSLKTGAKLALATLSPSAPQSADTTNTIAQLYADLYAYYTSVGAATAGLPLSDTLSCPAIGGNSCTYDIFDKNYALFAYHVALATGQNFTIRNAFFTEWTARLGLSGLGRPVDVETAFTAATGSGRANATFQTFTNGAIYVVSSGVNNGKTFSVLSPIYDLYSSSGGPGGTLGLPVTQEIVLSSGVHRQTFEGGILEYTPGGDPSQRALVTTVAISGATTGTTVALNLGDTLTLTASPMSATGVSLTDRPVTWSTSNSKVVSLDASGRSAVLHAVGGGVAIVTATSEGVVSPKVNLFVTAPCCQVGDGAPSTVQRSFNDALTRNKITAQTPVASPALRVGNGYVQVVLSADGGATYWLAESDKIGAAFVIGGLILETYNAMGGPAGPLGYPVTDRSAAGTQRFENQAALAGNPVRLVSGGVLAKWGLMGYETGAAGGVAGDAIPFATFGANSGNGQAFANATIYAANSGPKAAQAYAVSGLILARYTQLGGPGGSYGMPVSDEFVTGGVHQQNFEGGNFTWAPGDGAAADHASPKTPGVVALPATVAAGATAKLAIIGFGSGAVLKVSVSGQPDFTVTTASGAFSWDYFVPLSTRSGTVTVSAVDTQGGATATGTLTVKGFNDSRVTLVKSQGDNQTGPPGSLLPLSLKVMLRDSSGNGVAGAAVRFSASSGTLSVGSATTGAAGLAETWLRLPPQEVVALVNVDSPGVASSPVTFAVRSAAAGLSNFPKLQQAGSATIGNGTATITQKGALLTALSSMLRYHQNRSELPGPNGSADPVALNAFLKGYCPPDAKGSPNCDGYLSNPDSGEQVVNLWRAAEFTGGADIEVAAPTAASIADWVSDGSPVLVALGLTRNGVSVGGHYVVGIGVAADGSIAIQDPNTTLARASLKDYLSGFTLGGDSWKGELRGVARFALTAGAPGRFLVAALSQTPSILNSMALDVASAAGACGPAIDLPDAMDATSPGAISLTSRMLVCDGSQPLYQLLVGTGQPYRALTDDLAPGGSQTDVSGSQEAAYQVTRVKLNVVVSPQGVNFAAGGVVGGATFTAGIAPGGVVSIFGSGLSGIGKATSVDFDGIAMKVLFATPFQVNAEVPLDASPGTHVLHLVSAYGESQQQVAVSEVAPGIFTLGDPTVGAITNTSYGLVGPTNPLARGQTLIIFATGLGAVRASGGLNVTTGTVTVLLGGVELPVQFAGLAPGYPGLYQVNVLVPPATAPGSGISLALKVGGQISNKVTMALQ